MKKITILALALGTCTIAQAQVLSNGEISKSLFDTNYFLDASNFQGQADVSKGKLLGFPKTDLTQFKFDLKVVTDEVTLSGFDGVVVYNTATGKTGSDANTQGKVVDVTPGFYYFSNPNGATNQTVSEGKWVRLSDSQANDQLWAQRDNNGVTETYLKPADANGDTVAYKTNTGMFLTNLGGGNTTDDIWTSGGMGIPTNEIPHLTIVDSKVLPTVSHIGSTNGSPTGAYRYASNLYLLQNEHAERNNTTSTNKKSYLGNSFRLITADNLTTSNISSIEGSEFTAALRSNITIERLTGGRVNALNGRVDITQANVGTLRGIDVTTGNYGTITSSYGARIANSSNYGTIGNIYGINNTISSQNSVGGVVPAHAVKVMYGIDNVVSVSENATVETGTNGIRSASYFRQNSKNPLHYGIYNYNRTYAGANVDKLYGARYFFVNDATATIGEMYGLYIDDVNKGATKNYAIYTGLGTVRFGDNVGVGVDTPVEKLEVAGKVKASAFMGTNGATLFPDYVFQKYYTGTSSIKADYSFKTLSQVEDFVKTNGIYRGISPQKLSKSKVI